MMNAMKPARPEVALPEHLVALGEEESFAVWRWACLRGTGFPAAMVSQLTAPSCARGADQLLLLEEEIDGKHSAAIAALRHDLENCTDGDKRKKLLDALIELKKRKVTTPLEFPCEEARQSFWKAYASQAAAKERFKQEFRAGISEVSANIRKVVADLRFQQAVLLQNPVALRLVANSLLVEGPVRRAKKERQKEELAAKYLQRYCMKNDTIGFFGPVGWLRFNPECGSIRVQAGSDLIAKSTFYFELWCIEALAEKIAEDASLREWMTPRRLPAFYLEGSKLYLPGGTSKMLPGLQAAVLNRCTGEATAREIATGVMARGGNGPRSKEEVYSLLGDFERRGMIAWKFEVSWFQPEQSLRRLLQRIGIEEKQRAALEMLEELEQAREQVSGAYGDAARLDEALRRLEETFTRLTGKSTTRYEGQMYAGRTLIYQECRRDMELELGREVIDALSAPLALLLRAARWFSWEVGVLVREQCLKIFRATLREGRTDVELMPIWLRVPKVLEANGPLFQRVREELQGRWQKILQVSRTERHMEYRSGDLKKAVEETFAAPGYGWQTSRHHSPDVMIAASSVEAIHKGDFFLVMGELHMAINTLRAQFVMSQHPFPEQLSAAIEADNFPEQVIFSRSHSRTPTRTLFTLDPSNQYYIETRGDSLSTGPRSRTLPISAFIVRETREGLFVQTRDGRHKFEIVEFFGEMLSWSATDCMKMVPSGAHIPRLTIDRVVVQREQWSWHAAEMRFATKGEECDRFLEARRWMHAHGLPRYIFVKAAIEEKPFYVDLESPVYVEILAKLVRRVLISEQPDLPIVVTEMLPNPDQLWLPDKDNRRYSSELRMAVVDRTEEVPSSAPDPRALI
jgi:hypothetical protein